MRPRNRPAWLWVLAAALILLASGGAARGEPPSGFVFGLTDRPVFERLYADILDPHFGIRIYWDHPVPGTLHDIPDPNGPDANARAAAPNGNHLFWDVAFGERGPLVGWYRPCLRPRAFTCGVALSLVAAVYVLLDVSSQSTGVLDTDYRVGGSIDGRPWVPGLDRISLSLGYYHQSSHLGDEYVLSAPTIQGDMSAPQLNPFLPYRANPAMEAFPVVLSVDLPELRAFRFRVYGGVTFLASTALPVGPMYRAGAEIRLDAPFDAHADAGAPGGNHRRFARWRRDLDFLLTYQMLLQRRYTHVGPVPGPPLFQQLDGDWVTSHGMLMALYNLDLDRSSTNAVGVAIELLWGRVQHGQFIEYATVGTAAASVSYYW